VQPAEHGTTVKDHDEYDDLMGALGRLDPALNDRGRLERVIDHARIAKNNGYLYYDEDEQLSLEDRHKFAAPLARVLTLLRDPTNHFCFVRYTSFSAQRYAAMLRDRDEISRMIPKPPKRKRGRPATPQKVEVLVKVLVEAWEGMTGKTFHQGCHEGLAISKSKSAQFVHVIVKYIAPEHLGQLKKVAERIVAKHRKKISQKSGNAPN
jgi:hypothetical protein